MKLFVCFRCLDFVHPQRGKIRTGSRLLFQAIFYCKCRKSWGRVVKKKGEKNLYVMTIGGEAIPMAMCTNHLAWGIMNYHKDKRTSFINSYIIDPTQKINDVVEEKKPKTKGKKVRLVMNV